jgi:hypothetical protein
MLLATLINSAELAGMVMMPTQVRSPSTHKCPGGLLDMSESMDSSEELTGKFPTIAR